MIPNLGYHTNVKTLLSLPDEYFVNHKVFQVMVGSPRTFEPGSVFDLSTLLRRHPDITVIVHASYPVNISKSALESSTSRTLNYLVKFALSLDMIGIKYLVTHVGSRDINDDAKTVASYMADFCYKWLLATKECNIHLLLETDSGSKKNTKTGDRRLLKAVINAVNNPRVRMCIDTEHSYGAGWDMTDVDDYLGITECVHLNSVPSYVEFGGHLDRHSETTFAESKVDVRPWIDKFKHLPMIMEVADLSYVNSNYKWLEENYG